MNNEKEDILEAHRQLHRARVAKASLALGKTLQIEQGQRCNLTKEEMLKAKELGILPKRLMDMPIE
jgi:hypothetical protein